jgi:ribosome-binding factor A
VSLRTDRISQQLRKEIAKVLREEVTDPRLQMVTLMGVDVSPDLRNAVVMWSTFDPVSDPDPKSNPKADPGSHTEEIQQGLESAAGFIRHRLAGTLALRRMPELRFRYDPSLQFATETMGLLQEIRDGKETK